VVSSDHPLIRTLPCINIARNEAGVAESRGMQQPSQAPYTKLTENLHAWRNSRQGIRLQVAEDPTMVTEMVWKPGAAVLHVLAPDVLQA